ncbi:MAG: hypothetical protein AAGH78_15430 [Cyanobacteria bacterium P01_H01_bin.58]
MLSISPTTVIEALKKHRPLDPINRRAIAFCQEPLPAVRVVQVEVEMDEM